MAQIIVSANVVVPNGPQFAFSQTLEVDAYDKIEFTVPSNKSDIEVEVPGKNGGLQFIGITSDWFGAELTYKINKKSEPARTLDQPHLFAGTGAVSLFDNAKPERLFFSNSTKDATAKDASVHILIGRDATP